MIKHSKKQTEMFLLCLCSSVGKIETNNQIPLLETHSCQVTFELQLGKHPLHVNKELAVENALDIWEEWVTITNQSPVT